jgi:hypothetical protein
MVTIADIAHIAGEDCLFLEEYISPIGGVYSWFPVRYFRPLISDAILAKELATVREPDILEFDRMLKRVLG